MEGVKHRYIQTNGIRMHFVEQGEGPLVLLLHGFPEFWYSWRYQIPVLAKAGFHVVAPDLRGFGETEAPGNAAHYTSFHLIGDLIGLLDALDEQKVLLIGHDWGAILAWDFCLFRPDRVKAMVALSVPFFPRKLGGSFLSEFRAVLGEDFYMCRFQEPGKQEKQFKEIGTKNVFRQIIFKQLEPPKWFSEDDLNYYVENYEKSGFTGPLNLYRCIERTWELKAAWTNVGVQTPVLFIAADKDLVFSFPGIKEYIEKRFKEDVPNLKAIKIHEGGHFMHQECQEKVNEDILEFLKAHMSDECQKSLL